jgi:hypothetical protein
MLERAFETGVPARCIVADMVGGMSRGLRGWLEKKERSYVLAVTSSKDIYHEGRQRQARKVAQSLPEESWVRTSAGKRSKGERPYDWACVPLPDPDGAETGHWLLMRRGMDDPTECGYDMAYGPKETALRGADPGRGL